MTTQTQSQRTLDEDLLRPAPVVRVDDPVGDAIKKIVDAGLPALPVVDRGGKLIGIFGEREFMGALFPAYLGDLAYAGFVPHSLDAGIERRFNCVRETVETYVNTEHVDVGEDYSDTELAEIFLHHRVLVVPVVDDERKPVGVVSRTDFFRSLVGRMSRRMAEEQKAKAASA